VYALVLSFQYIIFVVSVIDWFIFLKQT